jgi:hypothetical protein
MVVTTKITTTVLTMTVTVMIAMMMMMTTSVRRDSGEEGHGSLRHRRPRCNEGHHFFRDYMKCDASFGYCFSYHNDSCVGKKIIMFIIFSFLILKKKMKERKKTKAEN